MFETVYLETTQFAIEAFCSTVYLFAQRRHWRFSQCFYGKSRCGHFLFTKNTADDIGGFTAVCVVGVLGAIHCEYRKTFVLAMCGIVPF